jgi:hypothetical protein
MNIFGNIVRIRLFISGPEINKRIRTIARDSGYPSIDLNRLKISFNELIIFKNTKFI